MHVPVTVRRHDGWWVVRCRQYHGPDVGPLLGCEQWWEDAMEIANDHSPTGHDPVGDCEPSWVQAAREFPEPETARITDLPDIDRYEEQQ